MARDLRRLAPRSAKPEELLERAETLDRDVAFLSDEGYDKPSRKLMRYQQRTTSERRRRGPGGSG